MTGRDQLPSDSVGGWRLPGWIHRLFVALAALDAAVAIERIAAALIITVENDWLGALVSVLQSTGPVAITLLPAAALFRRPQIWRENEPLFFGAVLLAIGELAPVVGRLLPAAADVDIETGRLVVSPLSLVGLTAFAAGIGLIATGLPVPGDATRRIRWVARVLAVVGIVAAIERTGVIAFAQPSQGLDAAVVVAETVGPVSALFVALLAYRAARGWEDSRRHGTERRVTAIAGLLWVGSTFANSSLIAFSSVIATRGDVDVSGFVAALSVAGLMSAAASIVMLAAYALGMSEVRILVARSTPGSESGLVPAT